MDHRTPRFLLFLILASSSPFPSGALANSFNVTIDDTHPDITYSPPNAWQHGNEATGFWNSTFATAVDLNANVTLDFTGVAIYFLVGPAIGISAKVSLDNAAPISLDPSPDVSPKAGILWYAQGLKNETHRLQISNTGSPKSQVLVDGFIISALYGKPWISPPASPPSPPPSNHTTNVMAGVIFGCLMFLFIILHFRSQGQLCVSGARNVNDNASEEDLLTGSLAGTGSGRKFSKVLSALGIARKSTQHNSGHDDGRGSDPTGVTQPGSGHLDGAEA